MKVAAVDLFCGAGGLSYGLQQSGVSVVAGIDRIRTVSIHTNRILTDNILNQTSTRWQKIPNQSHRCTRGMRI